jgi:phospholipase/carboxylesterase
MNMNSVNTNSEQQQMWLELAPHDGQQPTRLLVFLHGAGSRPETFAPLAIAWQYKFPGAVALVMQGLEPGATGVGYDWYPTYSERDQQIKAAAAAAIEVSRRVCAAQQSYGLDESVTTIIGFSQGATLALEMARMDTPCASVVVPHAARLLRPITAGLAIDPSIHLLHGELDSQVPAQHSVRAFRALRNAGARVSVDVIADGVHSIDQEMVNVGTTRVMQTVFRNRRPISVEQYGDLLTLSLDSEIGDETAPKPPIH